MQVPRDDSGNIEESGWLITDGEKIKKKLDKLIVVACIIKYKKI